MKMSENLISTLPDTPAKAAVIARARQLTDFKWIPLRDVPNYERSIGNTVLPAGVEVTGFPYSSTELQDKFITENVSFESFLTAIANPDSLIYSVGHGAYDCCNFGVVCNGLARYALGIKRRISTKCWESVPGMRYVAKQGEYTAEDIELCDVLYAYWGGRSHVALITDLLRDESGKIVKIEVSEAVRPSCKRRRFSLDEYFEKYKLFALMRYDYLENVPLLDCELDDLLHSGLDKKTPKICVNGGNKSNYLVGDEVVISVFGDDNDVVEVICNGKLIEEIKVGGRAIVSRRLGRGYYEARLKNANESVFFCVSKAKISFSVDNDILTVNADPCDPNSEILYFDFRVAGVGCASLAKYEELTDEEKQSGKFSRPIPPDGYNFKVYFKNAYGVWVHPMLKIR